MYCIRICISSPQRRYRTKVTTKSDATSVVAASFFTHTSAHQKKVWRASLLLTPQHHKEALFALFPPSTLASTYDIFLYCLGVLKIKPFSSPKTKTAPSTFPFFKITFFGITLEVCLYFVLCTEINIDLSSPSFLLTYWMLVLIFSAQYYSTVRVV